MNTAFGPNTVLHFGGNSNVFNHHPSLGRIDADARYMKLISLTPTPIKYEDVFDGEKVLNFISDKRKVFISLMNGPFHFLHDALGHAIYAINKFPDAQFIFDASAMYEFDDAYLNHFLNTLYKKNIDFKVIRLEQGDVIFANNFYYQQTMYDDVDAGNQLFKFFSDDIDNKDIEPFRKIYISRRRMHNRDYSEILADGPSFKHDNRIDDEPKLEEFLLSLGFEIIVPEEFESFKHQINYFYETKTAVSLTSSGLTCSAFMQPRGNVVELVNTMVVPLGDMPEFPKGSAEEAIHHYYVALSFNKDHNYFAIPNKTRKADDIINKIKSSESLRSVFGIK